jgi:hypothetical protein
MEKADEFTQDRFVDGGNNNISFDFGFNVYATEMGEGCAAVNPWYSFPWELPAGITKEDTIPDGSVWSDNTVERRCSCFVRKKYMKDQIGD